MDERKYLYNTNKTLKRLRHLTGMAIKDFNMITAGDRVMVCMSGGKDSYALLEILTSLQKSAPVDFELIPVHLNARLPGYPEGVMEDYLRKTGLRYHIIAEDVYSLIREKIPDGRNICSFCSRLRRGILYRAAGEIGATKIALGHHGDDVLGTFFLNLFYAGSVKSMPAKLHTDDGRHIVIRPLVYCRERDIVRLSEGRGYPLFPKNMCSLGENKMRGEIREMINDWDKKFPGRSMNMLRAMQRICPSHMLDRRLYDFDRNEIREDYGRIGGETSEEQEPCGTDGD
ncbi:tRNA 2-thiocytidine(32) synthetase TtcA [Succinimonas sp.]|uniref:tRNA 2-thiocytidine(32) synthetase TtcA n=1 Tax=Succinimonas sp. TaxID=1936151 RepID=UPI003868669E